MTHLQQICASMVQSQESLQSLFNLRRAQLAGKWINSPDLVEQVELAIADHKKSISLMRSCLQMYPAANDATTLPGAA